MEQRPDCADILPHDAEVIEWRQAHAALVARREALVQRRASVTASMPPLLEAAKYEGNNGIVARLEGANQLGAQAEGRAHRRELAGRGVSGAVMADALLLLAVSWSFNSRS